MRRAIGVLLVGLLCATPALAQSRRGTSDSHKGIKVIVGIGALAVGTAIAAKSSSTTTVSSGVGTAETSSFSSSQLITGLAIAGVGGIVLWDGLRSHDPDRPSTTFGVGVGKQKGGLFLRRSW